MDTRHIRHSLTTLAASLLAAASIASAGPTLIVERVVSADADGFALGFEARALCLRVVAATTGAGLRIEAPFGCVACRVARA